MFLRKLAALVCLLAWISPALAQDPPRIHPADPHRLTVGGATWTPVGYYPALGAFTTDSPDGALYMRLLDTLSAAGVNYIRTVFTMGQPYGDAMDVYLRTGSDNANDGRPKFDLTQFNQEYFDYWRRVVEYANQRGIVIQLCLIDSWHSLAEVTEDNGPGRSWGLAMDYYYYANNVNDLNVAYPDELQNPDHPVFNYQQALIRKAVETLGDLPNIVWEVANESGNTPWEVFQAGYLTDYERNLGFPEHLVIPRDLPGHQYVPGQCDNTPSTTHDQLAQAYSWNLVLITDNDCTDAATADVRRGKAWAALTAGAHIDFFHFDLIYDDVLASEDTWAGMRYLGLIRDFLYPLGFDLAGMVPLDGEVTSGWALGRSGTEYIIYLPEGGTTSIPALPGVRNAVWFNPRDGNWYDGGAGPEFTAPDNNDWVLYVIG